MLRLAIPFTLIALGTAVAACGDREPGRYDGDPSLDPAGVVQEYVKAIDGRDGGRVCELIAPYISGRYDLFAEDPDNDWSEIDGCPDFVSQFIGYVEDCCPDVFKHAELRRILSVERHDGLRRVRARIRLDLEGMGLGGGPFVETIDDEIWLARFDGSWRVANLDDLADAAAIPDLRSESGVVSPPGAPDVIEEKRAFAEEVARVRGQLREREASYRKLPPARTCPEGGDGESDPAGDQEWNGIISEAPPHTRDGDLLGVQVYVRGPEVCVWWRLAADITGPVVLTYVHRTGPTAGTFLQHFELELRADGTARVTSGMGDDGRPIPVPARIGVSGSQASMVLNRDSFARGQRDWDSKERPPLRKFGFSASAAAAVGEEKSVIDQLGPESSSTFRYPDGMPCPAEGCY